MTVGEMLERMSARELDEWAKYAAIEPFGEDRADLRMGILASVIANASRDPDKRPKPFEPKDFMPDFEPAPPPVDPEKEAAMIAAFEENARKLREAAT